MIMFTNVQLLYSHFFFKDMIEQIKVKGKLIMLAVTCLPTFFVNNS